MSEKLINFTPQPQPIPSTYNNGFSQYETISKLISTVNELINDMNEGSNEIEDFKNNVLPVVENEETRQLNEEARQLNEDNRIQKDLLFQDNENQRIANEIIREQVIGSMSAQLNEKANKEFILPRKLTMGQKTPRAIVTFIDDDGKKEVMTKLEPLFKAKGVPCVIALPSNDLITRNDCISYNEARYLQNELGWEIASHGKNHLQLSDLTPAEQEDEIQGSLEQLEGEGLRVNTIIYPYGGYNADTLRLSQEYFQAAATVESLSRLNKVPINTFSLTRNAIGSFFAGAQPGLPATNTLDYYKAMVDKAVSEGGWLIFMSHCWAAEHDATQQQYLSSTIDYIKSLSVPILTLSQGLELFGDYIDFGKNLRVTPTGDMLSDYNVFTKLDTPNNANIGWDNTKYKKGITYTTIQYSAATGWPENKPGMLITENVVAESGFMWQTYKVYNSDSVYERYLTAGNTWSAWTKVTYDRTITDVNAYADTKTSFTSGVYYTKINGVGKGNFPVMGDLVTIALDDEQGFIKQFLYEYNGIRQYARYLKLDGTWSTWAQQGTKREKLFQLLDFGSIGANSFAQLDVDLSSLGSFDLDSGYQIMATPYDGLKPGLLWNAWPIGGNKARIRLYNGTGSTIADTRYDWRIAII